MAKMRAQAHIELMFGCDPNKGKKKLTPHEIRRRAEEEERKSNEFGA